LFFIDGTTKTSAPNSANPDVEDEPGFPRRLRDSPGRVPQSHQLDREPTKIWGCAPLEIGQECFGTPEDDIRRVTIAFEDQGLLPVRFGSHAREMGPVSQVPFECRMLILPFVCEVRMSRRFQKLAHSTE